MKIEYRRSSQVYTEVTDGDADLGLVAFPTKRTGLVVEDFWRDKLVLICHPAHPLAERRRVRLKRPGRGKIHRVRAGPADAQGHRPVAARAGRGGRSHDGVRQHRDRQAGGGDRERHFHRAGNQRGGRGAQRESGVGGSGEFRHVATPREWFTGGHRAISPAQKQFVGMLKEARWMDNGNGTEPSTVEHSRRPWRRRGLGAQIEDAQLHLARAGTLFRAAGRCDGAFGRRDQGRVRGGTHGG